MNKYLSLSFLLIFLLSTANGCNSAEQDTPPSLEVTAQAENTVIVTSSADSGPGTLRQALLEALPGDTITFDSIIFPQNDPATIKLKSSLPELTQGSITIDGSNAGVILDGSQTDSGHGLSISSDGNAVYGLQIVNFPDAGIGLFNGAQNNIIGGDRELGTGPLGQGNLISGNGNFGVGLWDEGTTNNTIQGNYIGVNLDASDVWGHPRDGIHSNGAKGNFILDNVIGGNDTGVYICCVVEGKNVVSGNIIGTDPTGTIRLSNHTAGVLVDRSNDNIIGPGNLIAYNNGLGVAFWDQTAGNTVTENLIRDNGVLVDSSLSRMAPPIILDFNLENGSVTGLTCPNCIVEVFSDEDDEGGIFEGRIISDMNGAFELIKDIAFIGPHITANSTDSISNTSGFSAATYGLQKILTLQTDNVNVRYRIGSLPLLELANNRIGDTFPLDIFPSPCPSWQDDWSFTHVDDLGFKWARLSIDRLEYNQVLSSGQYSQFKIDPCQDEIVTQLARNGVTIMHVIEFWDETLNVGGDYPRYQKEEEIQGYLDYTRFIVRHFKGKIQYYEILNEPCNGDPQQYVAVADYINLIRRVIPVIHEEDPEAKIVVGGSSNLMFDYPRDYFLTVLQSDVMPLVDGISLHPMYGTSPQYEDTKKYYYEYPEFIMDVKEISIAHGFSGEFFAEEMAWRTTLNPNPYEPWEYTPNVAAKYYARGIVINLGLGLWAGIGGERYDTIQSVVNVVKTLNTTMAGAKPSDIQFEVQSDVENLMSYSFTLDDGSSLLAIWNDGIATDDAVGIPATIIFPDFFAKKVAGIDVLNGFEQELTTIADDGQLVIPNLLIMDYPILIRIEP